MGLLSAARTRRLGAAGLAALGALSAAGAAQASFTQGPGSPFPVGTNPYGVVAADFNGDGAPDVAAINGTSSNLSVLLNQGGGALTQEAGSPIGVGTGPNFGATADFNGDGRPDIAVANFVADNVTVLLRQAGGGFAQDPGSPFPVSGQASSVAAADFNGDGRPDLAAPNYNNATVTILLRQPAGGFAAEGSPIAVGLNPRNLAAADFNGDGLPDLAVTNLGSGTVSILLRQAAGGFAVEAGSPIAVGSSPSGIGASDVNGDGRPDLAVADYGSSTVTILLRQAGGGFAQETGSPIAVGTGPIGLAAGDFNADQRPDLAVTSNSAGGVTVLLRQAAGGYAPDAGSPLVLPNAYNVAVADFNADQRPDLAVSSDATNSVTVLLNTTAPPPVAPAPSPPPPPVPGKSVVVRVVSGTVFVKYPRGYRPRARLRRRASRRSRKRRTSRSARSWTPARAASL
jgi:hypothetical protein